MHYEDESGEAKGGVHGCTVRTYGWMAELRVQGGCNAQDCKYRDLEGFRKSR